MSNTEENAERAAVSSTDWLAVTEWEHPHWDQRLVLPDDGSRGTTADYLGADEDAGQLNAYARYEMTPAELDELDEWNG